jgi:hypothetical protein
MYRNSFDKTGECSAMGEAAENSFSRLLSKKGTVRPASTFQQMRHIDFILTTSKGENLRYEVKARKRVSRSDDQVNDDTVYLEFLNVRGDAGWLYGKSNFIAFEREKDFVIVDRLKLVKMAETKCDLALKVSSPSQCLYKAYTRWGRHDLISRVMMLDIEAIADEVWVK